ncbi:hypothetical protein [Streptomyces sp. MBT33]|uniref:hypothetical protein n=1 Tax=Streptomyces sp. MBT33 TaxID=1488363 RepID=UPI00190AC4CB|nr:hypothetical protein [Streptomyces sp. MBT33]MBK3642095.1 hypothetical protein [Streptomyces sp. MBT33]
MPFARMSWPGDHRDEIVAGALVAAVIVVLGYASGIGSTGDQSVNVAAPPAAKAPTPPSERSSSGPTDTGTDTGGSGGGTWEGSWPLPVSAVPTTGSGTQDGGGHAGHGGAGPLPDPSGNASPSSSPSWPASSSPSPSPSQSCEDGEVHLVQPLLNGVITPVTGLLDGLSGLAGGSSPSLAPSASPSVSADSAAASADSTGVCVGVASDPAVVAELTR